MTNSKTIKKGGKLIYSNQSWLQAIPQAHEMCQVKSNQHICAKMNHHYAIC